MEIKIIKEKISKEKVRPKKKWHKTLTQERWNKISRKDQVLNIASELSRASHWLKENNFEQTQRCYERTFELIDLTLNGDKWQDKRKELARFREILGYLYLNKTSPLLCEFFYNWLIGFSQI